MDIFPVACVDSDVGRQAKWQNCLSSVIQENQLSVGIDIEAIRSFDVIGIGWFNLFMLATCLLIVTVIALYARWFDFHLRRGDVQASTLDALRVAVAVATFLVVLFSWSVAAN